MKTNGYRSTNLQRVQERAFKAANAREAAVLELKKKYGYKWSQHVENPLTLDRLTRNAAILRKAAETW